MAAPTKMKPVKLFLRYVSKVKMKYFVGKFANFSRTTDYLIDVFLPFFFFFLLLGYLFYSIRIKFVIIAVLDKCGMSSHFFFFF